MKKLAVIIPVVFTVILYIPMIVFGLVYSIAHLIFMFMQMFIAGLYDWAGYTDIALRYLDLLSDKRK